ncbi:MAG: hypothetical protein AUJ97_00150 [Bacteroidetes bacterium CG2_30_32_10]|nr:MAG: hypothetical protein AUJ97_00150 [Bacteroidetes bacterium CG2_30_32_10]
MKSKEFIEAKLNELYNKFSDIKIRYEYRANTFSHLIEIIPIGFFEGNEDYIILEAEIEDEFEASFPDENIVFISEGSLSEIVNPDFKLGYNSIKFDNEVFNFDFIIEGFSENVDFQYSNTYALAA